MEPKLVGNADSLIDARRLYDALTQCHCFDSLQQFHTTVASPRTQKSSEVGIAENSFIFKNKTTFVPLE